ncbi:MAG TPA: hypothetical protein VGL82_11900 [Bryobacteraceae bacterium]
MSSNIRTLIATGVALVAMAVPAFSQGRGPGGPKPPEGPTPRTADGKPDLSGLWERPYTPDMSAFGRNQSPDPSLPDDPAAKPNPNARAKKVLPFSALGKKEWDAYDAANGDYTGSCMPFGLTRSINSPDPLQIMQNPKYVGFLFEQNTWFHLARIGGTHPDPKKMTPTWFGDSVAKWDGDTLVVDTIGFNGRTRLDTIGHPNSAKMHVVEKYTRTDLGHIQYEMTIDDPVTYTKPWKNVRTFTLRPDWEIMEYSCEENNKDFFEGHIKATQDPNNASGVK